MGTKKFLKGILPIYKETNGCSQIGLGSFHKIIDIFFYMKQFKIVALSSTNQLLVSDSQKNTFEYPIEGFKIVPGPASRPLLEDLVGKTIGCTLNKAGTHIRYQNEAFLTEKIEQGAIEVVQKELQESKIYSADAKGRLIKVQKNPELKGIEVLDLCSNRKEMVKLFPRGGELKGSLQWLSEQMVVSVQKEGKILFVPIRLKAINTLFECLPESTFVHFLEQNFKINIKIDRPIYNLVKKRFELVGSLKNELELEILNQGWGTINTAALASVGGSSYQEYIKAEGQAKEVHRGVFSRNCQILAFIYAKNNFVGEVSDVLDGYIFEVTKRGGGKVKLELAMVRCPVGDQVGAFHSRQFSRKQLIGQEVNIYLHKDSGLNITGSIIRAKDSRDVEAMLVDQGWGFIREQFANSILSIKLADLEKKAKEKGKGLHSKDIGVHRPEDLTQPNTKKEDIYIYRREETLKKLHQTETGVLEGIVDLLTYRVWLEDQNVLLKVKLQGIQGHNINPLLEEVKKMKEDHKDLYQEKLKKRSIQVSITSYQKESNCYLGTITLQGGTTLQEALLEESLVYCDREGGALEKFKLIEKRVRDAQRGLWGPNLINFEPVDPLEMQSEKFKGKFSWVQDGQTVCIQPESNYKTLGTITERLRNKNMSKVTKESIVPGSLVVAPYFQENYRALILSIKGKKIRVVFIDWGNKETVEEGDLRQLPEELKFIEKQCLKAKLYLTKPIRNEQYLERIRNELMDGDEYQFKKEKGEYISTYKNKQNIVLSLLERGIAKGNPDMASPSTRDKILGFEEILKREKIGVWEWSDEEEEMDNSQEDIEND